MTEHEGAEAGIEELLAEQLRWLRAAAMPQVRETINAALSKTQMRRAYELCDGKSTNAAIGKKVGASEATMSRWTTEWRHLGIAYDGEKGIRHLVSLKALGLPIEVQEG
jgi:hypothetical protein